MECTVEAQEPLSRQYYSRISEFGVAVPEMRSDWSHLTRDITEPYTGYDLIEFRNGSDTTGFYDVLVSNGRRGHRLDS